MSTTILLYCHLNFRLTPADHFDKFTESKT